MSDETVEEVVARIKRRSEMRKSGKKSPLQREMEAAETARKIKESQSAMTRQPLWNRLVDAPSHAATNITAGILGSPVDIPNAALNLGRAAYGFLGHKAGWLSADELPELQSRPYGGSERIKEGFDAIGLPSDNPYPFDPWSKATYEGTNIAGSIVLPSKSGPARLAQRSPKFDQRATGMQIPDRLQQPVESLGSLREIYQPGWTGISSAAGGSAAYETDDPRIIAAATMAAPTATALFKQGSRKALFPKKSDEAKVRERIQNYERAGIYSLTVGEALEKNWVLGFEDVLSHLPFGGHSKFSKVRESRAEDVRKLVPTGSSDHAAREISRGVNGWQKRTSDQFEVLNNRLYESIGLDTRINPTNMMRTLGTLSKRFPDDPYFDSALRSETGGNEFARWRRGALEDIEGKPAKPGNVVEFYGPDNKTVIYSFDLDGIPAVAGKGGLTLRTLREFRTYLGDSINGKLVASHNQADIRRLWGAISEDIRDASRNATYIGRDGKTRSAEELWERQNTYWRERQKRLDKILLKVVGPDGNNLPEEIFGKVFPKRPDESSVLSRTMRSLLPEEREVVSKAIINRLGMPTAEGKIDPNVDAQFDLGTFFKNWTNLHKNAKAIIAPDKDHRDRLDLIAKAVFDLAKSKKEGELYSGRYSSYTQVFLVGTVAGAGYKHGLGGMAITAAGITGGIHLGSKLLTNQNFVRWLADGMKPVDSAQHMMRLNAIYQNSDLETRTHLNEFISSVSQFWKEENAHRKFKQRQLVSQQGRWDKKSPSQFLSDNLISP